MSVCWPGAKQFLLSAEKREVFVYYMPCVGTQGGAGRLGCYFESSGGKNVLK